MKLNNRDMSWKRFEKLHPHIDYLGYDCDEKHLRQAERRDRRKAKRRMSKYERRWLKKDLESEC